MSQALVDAIIAELSQQLAQLPSMAQRGTHQPRHIWLGFSGGMDSALLAYALSLWVRQQPELRPLVHLVHVHHGLNTHADAWAVHCMALAKEYQLDGRVLSVTLNTGARVSIEAEARKQRYQALAELMQPQDVLLTAHHQDDQLETVLLALKRGQGPKGLAGMGARQTFQQDCWQLRPMLNISREQIEQAVDGLALDYVDDDSNFDTRYDRNFLRQQIIPDIKQRWPAFAETASRSAALCAEEQALLQQVAAEKLQGMLAFCDFSQQATLLLAPWRQYSGAWQRQLLRQFCLLRQVAPPSQLQLLELQQQLAQASADANIALNFGHVMFRRFNDALYVAVRVTSSIPSTVSLTEQQQQALCSGELTLALNGPWRALTSARCASGPRIALHQLQGYVELRFAVAGSCRCHPHWRHQGRELKKVWQEAKLPTWLRGQVPLLYVDGKLVAAAGVFVEQEALAAANETGIRLQLCNE